MPDRSHTMLAIDLPVSLTEAELREIYIETSGQVAMADFPLDVRSQSPPAGAHTIHNR